MRHTLAALANWVSEVLQLPVTLYVGSATHCDPAVHLNITQSVSVC